ncbi:MAG: prolyl oligopeptidase family serine peptidase [Chlamydiales bacterium]|nr:prolyl oligopeptidase family serine peptidase [Chlamydiales bacterium]
MPHNLKEIHPFSGQSLYYTGPDVSEGPLPALFYFCASGHDSLATDPFNQPVIYLSKYPIRVFSMTLPFHGPGFDNKQAVGRWADAISRGSDLLNPFLKEVLDNIDYLLKHNIILEGALAAAGLSRGGLIATHLAARSPHIKAIAAFAPLTDLFYLDEFQPMRDNALVKAMNLQHVVEQLIGKSLRYYIGNRDMRVGTDACFAFIHALVEASYTNRVRSPAVELIIAPSIGHQGHGTSQHTFNSGARWILSVLGITNHHEEP